MLESDYLARFRQLTRSVSWGIELPSSWKNYFQEKGPSPSYPGDGRMHPRIRLRTHGVVFFDNPLPSVPRSSRPMGVYTKDFSRQGCGFLINEQLFPEEEIRLVLPSFWTRLTVVRARRITSHCYEIGATLNQRFDPEERAFQPCAVHGPSSLPSSAASTASV
ncbi:PilZ domain-containing protein [Crateriforma conspicua]|uniref:PilZ domain-containing protein n=1 Tax=Crateriforma conspicua TaxID=2527996 RepID=A0A5C5XSG8_9PLAN|nr:PilZ domain-containing protein [Crateriforma conspicua]QDV60985.1 hypothetical protein Mal65_01060 [Crateriforma conspicua]TWT65820.1 hypothetical protein Pan14r_53700 [Crateriforma conspicua]